MAPPQPPSDPAADDREKSDLNTPVRFVRAAVEMMRTDKVDEADTAGAGEMEGMDDSSDGGSDDDGDDADFTAFAAQQAESQVGKKKRLRPSGSRGLAPKAQRRCMRGGGCEKELLELASHHMAEFLSRNEHPALTAWLRAHFLHPYPTAAQKAALAQKSSLTQAQVVRPPTPPQTAAWRPRLGLHRSAAL